MPRPRRLPRILLNAATAASLVLCLWTGTLWVRSMLEGTYFDTPQIVHLGATPAYQVAAISALPPILWCSFRLIGTRYRRSGLCARCGYDLRATPAWCPECGAVPARREQTESATDAHGWLVIFWDVVVLFCDNPPTAGARRVRGPVSSNEARPKRRQRERLGISSGRIR